MDEWSLLLVGAGKQGLGYLTAASRMRVPVRLIEFPAYVSRSRPLVERVAGVETMLDESWYAGALNVIGEARPAGVVAFSEPHVLPAALLQDNFAVPGPGLHAAVISRDKALQRALFATGGVAQPAHQLRPTLKELTSWAEGRFPVVVKPLAGAGSSGVELVSDATAWAAVVERRGAEGPLLAEEAIDGPEFSAECLVRDGEVLFTNITEKETTGPPYFIEVCHRPGYQFPSASKQEEVKYFIAEVLRMLLMRTGIAHMEFRYGPHGPVLMEVAVRTPGDFLMEIISLTWGFDMFEATIALALGLPVDLPQPGASPLRATASRFLFAPPGRMTAVTGQPEIEAHPAVARCVLNYQPGDELPPVRSSPDRAGHVLIAGTDPREREAALQLVETTLLIHTEPAKPGPGEARTAT